MTEPSVMPASLGGGLLCFTNVNSAMVHKGFPIRCIVTKLALMNMGKRLGLVKVHAKHLRIGGFDLIRLFTFLLGTRLFCLKATGRQVRANALSMPDKIWKRSVLHPLQVTVVSYNSRHSTPRPAWEESIPRQGRLSIVDCFNFSNQNLQLVPKAEWQLR